MPDLNITIDPNTSRQVRLSWASQSFPLCCGAHIITGVNARGFEKGGAFGAREFTPTFREIYTALDTLDNAAFLRSFDSPGFTVLTDQINKIDPETKKTDTLDIPDAKDKKFGTKDFVEYLINRKRGVVTRGPYTENTVHRGASIVVAWIWVPNQERLLEPSPAAFGIPEKLTTTYPKLAVIATAHKKRQEELVNIKIDPLPIPKLDPTKVPPKPADPFAGEYRQANPTEKFTYENQAIDLAYKEMGQSYEKWARELTAGQRAFLINKHIVALADAEIARQNQIRAAREAARREAADPNR